MDYKARLLAMRQSRVVNVIQQAEQERRLRHEIAMDSLAAERGLHGLSDEDRSIIEAASIEMLIVDSLFNTIPKKKRDKMVKQAVKKALSNVAEDLKFVVRQVVNHTESQLSKKGNYAALRTGNRLAFNYYGENYVEIDVEARTFKVLKVPAYATARRMVRYLAELCGVELPDLQEKTYNFKVIHEIHS